MNLSRRMLKIAEYINYGEKVADIGTDHAFIPIYLVKKKGCVFAIASDLNKGPAEAARNNIMEAGLEDYIEVRLGDGLSVLTPGEVQTVIIAGMGGATITDILARDSLVVKQLKKLVLQPMTDEEVLRGWLNINKWRIKDEELIHEDGRIYTIIVAEQGVSQLTADEVLFGPRLLAKKHPLLRKKLQKEAEHKKEILARIEKNAGIKAAPRLEELKGEIKRYERVLKWL